MPRNNARDNEHAWRDRAQESSAHQAAAAGMGPPPGLGGRSGGGAGRSTPVYVTGASSAFLNQVSENWSMPRPAGSEPATGGSGSMDPLLNDQRAINELSRQMAEDLQVTARMVLDHQASATRAMVSFAQDMRVMRQEERDHMQRVLDMLSTHSEQQLKIAESIQGAWASMATGAVAGYAAGTAASSPGATSGSPMPGRRSRRGPVIGAYSTSTGIGTVHAPPGGTAGGFVPTPLPYNRPVTRRSVRQGMFRAMNQRWGIPAANAAQQPPSGMQNVVSNIATPMSGMSGTAGLRAIPVLGGAIAAEQALFDGMEWLTEQRKANAQYQQIYSGDNFGLTDTIQGLFGGDVNTGSGQRAAGFNFKLSQMFSHGGLTGEDADKLFQGVSSLGYNNDERDRLLRFGTGMYKQEGMSVDDSMRLIQTSAQYANESLAGVAEGLENVSKAAQHTSQSAKTLRDTFTGYYTSALAGGAGASASTIAESMTLSTAGISRQLASANLSPMLNNPMYMQQIASGAGMTPGQLQSQMAQGNFRAFTGSAQKILDQRMLGVMDPGVRDKFKRLVSEYGGNEVVAEGPGAISSIATELMGDRGWNVYAARSALQSIGVDTSAMNDQQVAEFFVSQMTSGGIDAQAKQKMKENAPQSVERQKEEHGGVTEFSWNQLGFKDQSKFGFRAASEYQKIQERTGKTDPGMEAAIKHFGSDDNARVKVQTKQGARIVTIDEAIRDYGDQVSSGSAIVASGENKGKKLSEITGVVTTGVVPGKDGVPNSAKENAKSGVDVESYEKVSGQDKTNSDGTANGGTVTISPSPELARMFNFNTTGNITVDQSAAQGVPPTVNGPIR